MLAELISQFVGMEKSELPFPLLPRLGWLFSNETGRQESVTLMGVPDTWKWDLDPHAGIEKEDWEELWRCSAEEKENGEEEAELPEDWVTGQGRWPGSKNSSKGPWVTRNKKHITEYTAVAANTPVWFVSAIWQAYKD